ncbi:DNA primase, partial [Crocosphaera sp. Alani8]
GRGELIERIDTEMERLGWTSAIGKDYLVNRYGVSSRQRLNDDQLLEFYQNLKGASVTTKETPKYEVGQFLQGLLPHPMGMMKVEGKVVEENGDRWLKDENGVTYPLAVMEGINELN